MRRRSSADRVRSTIPATTSWSIICVALAGVTSPASASRLEGSSPSERALTRRYWGNVRSPRLASRPRSFLVATSTPASAAPASSSARWRGSASSAARPCRLPGIGVDSADAARILAWLVPGPPPPGSRLEEREARCRPSSVNDQALAGDERRFVRGEEEGCRRNLLGGTEPAKRGLGQVALHDRTSSASDAAGPEAIDPGVTQLARMPLGPPSTASCRVKAITPPLPAACATLVLAEPRSPAVDAVLTMLPPLARGDDATRPEWC